MKLELTPEQRAARAEFRAFVEAEIVPHAGAGTARRRSPPSWSIKLRERG